MGVKFFGQFLVEAGVLSGEQLLAATKLQDSRNRPLGAIAVEKGFLTAAQAEQLNHEQMTTDRRFGELAMAHGLMTAAQVDEVLGVQKAQRIKIGEAIEQLGYVSGEALAQQLARFEEEQAIYRTGKIELPADVGGARELLAVSIDLTEKLLLRVAHLNTRRGVVRVEEGGVPAAQLVSIRIAFSGALKMDYLLGVPKDIALTIAAKMLGGEAEGGDELAVDAVREFANVVCGNVCGKLTSEAQALEIGPPEDGPPSPAGRSVVVPLHLPEGEIELRMYC